MPAIGLMLTDIVMPEMHGLDLADRVAVRYPGLHVVLMTGHAPELTAPARAARRQAAGAAEAVHRRAAVNQSAESAWEGGSCH